MKIKAPALGATEGPEGPGLRQTSRRAGVTAGRRKNHVKPMWFRPMRRQLQIFLGHVHGPAGPEIDLEHLHNIVQLTTGDGLDHGLAAVLDGVCFDEGRAVLAEILQDEI